MAGLQGEGGRVGGAGRADEPRLEALLAEVAALRRTTAAGLNELSGAVAELARRLPASAAEDERRGFSDEFA